MAMIPHEETIDEIYFRPYAYLDWDPNEIKTYLDLMEPNRCYYILQAKENSKRPDQKQEFYYGTSYTSEKLS
jgi:Middle or third domain of peptidase_M16